jgi:cell wall-associated NlpC family hydrolase
MSWLQRARGTSPGSTPRRFATTRRGATAVVVAAGLVLGATALVPTAGADQIGDKQAEAAKVTDQLEALKSRQMDISAQAERVGYEQSQAEQKVTEAQSLLDQTNADLEAKRVAVTEVAVEAYQNGNDSPELDAFLTSDANSGLQKKSYLETRTGDMRDKVDALSAAQQKAEDDKARLETAQKEVDAKAAEIDQLKSANQKAVADQQAVNAKVQGELSNLVAAEQARRAQEAKAASDAAAARQAAAAPTAPATQQVGAKAGSGSVVVPSNPNPPPVGHGAAGAIAAALSRVGVGSYVWGAAGPIDFDCSGLVAWAYAQAGVPGLPHYSGAQYAMTTRISRAQLQPGDLVFWGPGGSEHVAIYMGGNSLVHAFGSGGGVATTALDGWWKPATGYGRLNY